MKKLIIAAVALASAAAFAAEYLSPVNRLAISPGVDLNAAAIILAY